MHEEQIKDIRTYIFILVIACLYIGINFYIVKERTLDGVVEIDNGGVEIEFVKEK